MSLKLVGPGPLVRVVLATAMRPSVQASTWLFSIGKVACEERYWRHRVGRLTGTETELSRMLEL